MQNNYNRRQFISFIGKSGLGAVIMPQFLISCGNTTTPTNDFSTISKERLEALTKFVLEGLIPSDKDDLLSYHNKVGR
jgi:hypothetical protein